MAKPLLRTDNEVAEIYQRQINTVYRVCYTYMKNFADADDAVADTFVKMIRSAPAFESAEHEKAWLIRAASNICKDTLKHWWRKRENLPDYSETLEAEDNLEPDLTLEVVCSLPDKYKSVVLMHYYDGYTTFQISEILKKPQSTIRYLLFKARKILKERLGDDFQ